MTKTSDFISTKHTAYEALNDYHFSFEQWTEIFKYTRDSGLDIVMMPLNLEAFKLLDTFEIKYLDIHSVSFYDTELLKEIKKSNQEIILGVGGRTLEEIIEKVNYFKSKLKVMMVGFQSFPSQLEDVNIGKITYLKELFSDCHIGYADHSAFDNEHSISSNNYARILGATYFEKHITTAEGIDRVDFSAAVGPDKIEQIIKNINFIEESILTDFISSFSFNEKETTYRNRQLICVAAKIFRKKHCFKRKRYKIKTH